MTSITFFAYLDPGSGSMLVQLLVGGIAGAGVIFRLYGRMLYQRLTGRTAVATELPSEV